MSEATASQKLAEWVVGLRYSDIDEPTVAYARELLLDHLGCAARGGVIDGRRGRAHARRDRCRQGHGAHRRRRQGAAAAGVGRLRERRLRALDRARRHAQRELAAPGRRDDSGGARDRGAGGLERRRTAHRDRRRLRGRVPARARARPSEGLRPGLSPDRDRRAVRRRGGDRELSASRRRTRARVRHRRQPGGGPAGVLLGRRLDEALSPRLGLAQRLPRRASRAGRVHGAAARVRRARRRALGLRRRGHCRAAHAGPRRPIRVAETT